MPFDNWKQRSVHITRHCDLKAAAGLILILRNRGLSPRDSFQALFTRNGTLNSLQQTLTSFYGPNYRLQSLCLPWLPQEEDWQPIAPFLEERISRIPGNKAGEGRNCALCKGWNHRKCPFCRLQTGRRARRQPWQLELHHFKGDYVEKRAVRSVHQVSLHNQFRMTLPK
jgi:hypothetical protein